MQNEWITDRQPTAEDAFSGTIVVPSSHLYGWTNRRWDTITEGEPWAPWPSMPPYPPKKTVEELARESVPDGYSFYEGDYRSPLPKGSKAFLMTDVISEEREWKSRLSISDGNEPSFEFFYAIPNPRYWENPSDLPKGTIWICNGNDTRGLITFIKKDRIELSDGTFIFFSVERGEGGELSGCRWSDHGGFNYEDGKECLVEGGSNE